MIMTEIHGRGRLHGPFVTNRMDPALNEKSKKKKKKKKERKKGEHVALSIVSV
jgi:hypothetical protein